MMPNRENIVQLRLQHNFISLTRSDGLPRGLEEGSAEMVWKKAWQAWSTRAPRAENAKINVTDEPYFGTYILCNYLPFSKADKGAQGGPQQHETPKHSPTDISKRLRS